MADKVAPLDLNELNSIQDKDKHSATVIASLEAKEEDSREKWGSKLDFILSCIGYAVGLGNILRFPYITGRNGGAAFMIAYFTMMVFAGLPIFYLELALGQYSQVSPFLLYRRMCPIFNGIGLSMIVITFFTEIYYNVGLSWALRYMYATVFENVPWSRCRKLNDGGTLRCFDDKIKCSSGQPTEAIYYYDGMCNTYNQLMNIFHNDTDQVDGIIKYYSSLNGTAENTTLISPAQAYNDYVLGYKRDEGILENFGSPKWDLILALIVAWICVFLVLINGVKSSGKVVYFTATFPYVLLTILLVIGNSQPNSSDGITFYLSPNFTKLREPSIWADAASQIFFSLSVGGGGLTTLASYNQFNNNLLRDTLIVVLGNCATSIFAGFVIFPILGFIAANTHKTVAEVARDGPILAYVSYPDALTRVGGPVKLYSLLFFFMLVLLGIDSQLVLVEVVVTTVVDRFPWFQRTFRRRLLAVATVCILSFLLGILLTTPQGPALYSFLDTYAGGITLVIACWVELVSVSYFYGFRRFLADITVMLGRPPNRLWRLLGYPTNIFWHGCWLLITPLLLFVVLIANFIGSAGTFKYQDKDFPPWAVGAGWTITFFCVMWIPLYAIFHFVQACLKKSGYRWLITATDEWGPKDPKARTLIDSQHPYLHFQKDSKETSARTPLSLINVRKIGYVHEGHLDTKQCIWPLSYTKNTYSN